MEFGLRFNPAIGPNDRSGQQYWNECLHLVERADPLQRVPEDDPLEEVPEGAEEHEELHLLRRLDGARGPAGASRGRPPDGWAGRTPPARGGGE